MRQPRFEANCRNAFGSRSFARTPHVRGEREQGCPTRATGDFALPCEPSGHHPAA